MPFVWTLKHTLWAILAFVLIVAAIIILTQWDALTGKAEDVARAETGQTLAEASVDAGAAASEITERHYIESTTRLVVQQENRDAILSDPAAGQSVDAGLFDTWCRGLQRYEGGRDACAGVQPVYPPVVADAGGWGDGG